MKTMSIFELLPGLTKATHEASKIKAHISMAIFKARKALNLDQKGLAEKCDVSQAMISKWESGHYNFSIESLAEIADKLDLDLEVTLVSKERRVKPIELSKFTSDYKMSDKRTFDYKNSAYLVYKPNMGEAI